jgi:hypothetical protein
MAMHKTIGVYDHTTRSQVIGDLVQAIVGVKDSISSAVFSFIEKERAEAEVIDALSPLDVVVGHFKFQDSWNKLVKSSAKGKIRIRTSTAGRSGHKHTNENGVFVLQLQLSHNSVSVQEWRIIIEHLLTSGAALKIVNGEIPSDMTKFFGSGTLEVLPALSILCQGYLIVCANQSNEKVVPEYLKRWVSEQWAEMSKRVGVIDVQKLGFWNVFGEKDTDGLVNLAKSEWNGLADNGESEKVWKLLSAVAPNKQAPNEKLVATNEKLVADVFEAIERKLGAKRGK